jgi:hypothetical protein
LYLLFNTKKKFEIIITKSGWLKALSSIYINTAALYSVWLNNQLLINKLIIESNKPEKFAM